jgi:hypothetical protein
MDVTIRCICPPKGDAPRHPDGDTVVLRDKLGCQGVAAIRWAVAIQKETNPQASLAETFGLLTEQYVLAGVESWTLVDDKGKPVAVDAASIRAHLLTPEHIDEAIAVADVADDLYLAVVLPLLTGSSTSSPPTPTTGSTSPRTGSSAKRPKRSKPSSISTIPTGGTVVTSNSLEFDSNSSQSSESAA